MLANSRISDVSADSLEGQGLFNFIGHLAEVPVVLVDECCRQGATVVTVFDRRLVAVRVAIDVGKLATDGVQDCLRRARVPLLAAGAGKEVGVCPAFDQQQHLQCSAAKHIRVRICVLDFWTFDF